MQKLWTKNFTIITIGTIISMFGNAVAGFAMGLLVYADTGSTLMFALFSVCYSIPKIVLPLVAGPFIDRFSRSKIIYTLDFISSGIFGFIALLLSLDMFSYAAYLIMSIIIGSIDSVYAVAYESLYPALISKGNFSKAYSISSLIYPIASTIMVPIAGVCYQSIGLVPLFIFNAISFFIAACFETQIKYDEAYIKIASQDSTRGFRRFAKDMKEGIDYLRSEPGLMAIAIYFFFTMMCSATEGTLLLPYFTDVEQSEMSSLFGLLDLGIFKGDNGAFSAVTFYTVLMSIATAGRLVGGVVHYRTKINPKIKFNIAITVYTAICFIDGAFLYLPVEIMSLLKFASGFLAVNSFNIRISSTQNYIPDEKRGRFNGIFQMIMTGGTILGQLISGALGESFGYREIILGGMAVNLVAVFAVMYARRSHVKKIYNCEV